MTDGQTREEKTRKEKKKEDLTPKDGEKTKKWAKQYKLSHRCS
jgi:hypothetical protein